MNLVSAYSKAISTLKTGYKLHKATIKDILKSSQVDLLSKYLKTTKQLVKKFFFKEFATLHNTTLVKN